MSKKQSQISMSRHKRVDKFLRENLLGCEIHYDGVEGIDHTIVFNDKPTYIEVKTCDKIIKKKKPELGRFKFNRDKRAPYIVSQHDDLIKDDGWSVFQGALWGKWSTFKIRKERPLIEYGV